MEKDSQNSFLDDCYFTGKYRGAAQRKRSCESW